jgi:glycerol-3-phosphate acyltransferase PlsY
MYFTLASTLAAYLTGSIPFGFIAGKVFHRQDIRQGGSGNIGATNALRQYGMLTGVGVLLLDILKGVLTVFVLYSVLEYELRYAASPHPALNSLLITLPALAVVLGHMFSIFLGFKGGKGVATAAGVFLFLAPVPSLLALLTFVIVAAFSRYVSAGSVAAALSLNLYVFLYYGAYGNLAFTFIVSALIIFKHRENIVRLIDGRENKLSFKKKAGR